MFHLIYLKTFCDFCLKPLTNDVGYATERYVEMKPGYDVSSCQKAVCEDCDMADKLEQLDWQIFKIRNKGDYIHWIVKN